MVARGKTDGLKRVSWEDYYHLGAATGRVSYYGWPHAAKGTAKTERSPGKPRDTLPHERVQRLLRRGHPELDVDATERQGRSDPVELLKVFHSGLSNKTINDICLAVDWSEYHSREVEYAISLAVRIDIPDLARRLVEIGQNLFPDSAAITKAARVLRKPDVRRVKQSPMVGLVETRDWLRKHSKNYSGQGVAVRRGQLIGNAPTFKELVAGMERSPDGDADTLVTKIR